MAEAQLFPKPTSKSQKVGKMCVFETLPTYVELVPPQSMGYVGAQ